MNARIQTRDDYNNMTSGEIIEKQENRKKMISDSYLRSTPAPPLSLNLCKIYALGSKHR
jgi:hypothetical protein